MTVSPAWPSHYLSRVKFVTSMHRNLLLATAPGDGTGVVPAILAERRTKSVSLYNLATKSQNTYAN